MDDTLLLDTPWPDGLDPAEVPFFTRNVTILRRMGYYDDWTLFNTLTEDEVWLWMAAGVDLRTTLETPRTKGSALPRQG